MNNTESHASSLADTTPVMPVDAETVQLLLGALLYTTTDRALKYLDELRLDYFYPANCAASICYQNIIEEPIVFDHESLYTRLQKKSVHTDVLAYALSLKDVESWKRNDEGYVESLIERVRHSWQLRTTQKELNRTSKQIDKGKIPLADIVRTHKERLESIIRTTDSGFLKMICVSDVAAQEVEWLAYPYIAVGKVTMLEGDPGIGKSHISLAFAAGVAAGAGLPGQKERTEPRNVLIASCEDGIADTIRPRLDRMGAHVKRIFVVGEPFTFDQKGLVMLEAAISLNSAAFVVIDPIQGFMGSGVDIHRTNETRPIMTRLAEIAERQRCAILCIRHLTKASGGKAIYRGIGSIDFGAAVRSILLAGCDPDDPSKKAIVQTKNNLAMFGDPIAYVINSDGFFWSGKSDLTDFTILGTRTGDEAREERSAVEDACEFLISCLKDGPVPKPELEKQAKEAGIAWATVRRAKDRLKIKSRKSLGSFGPWHWELPHTQKDEHLEHVGINETYNSNQPNNLRHVAQDAQQVAQQGAQKKSDEHVDPLALSSSSSSSYLKPYIQGAQHAQESESELDEDSYAASDEANT